MVLALFRRKNSEEGPGALLREAEAMMSEARRLMARAEDARVHVDERVQSLRQGHSLMLQVIEKLEPFVAVEK